MNHKTKPWHVLLLLGLVVAAYFCYCQYGEYLRYTFSNDEPSYTEFSFNSLKEILSSHRTVGLPLVHQIFSYFFKAQDWPYFQFICVSVALVALGFLLVRAGFHWGLAGLIVATVALDPGILGGFQYIWTETLSVSILLGATGFYFCYLFNPRRWDGIFFTLLLFASYQVRPSLAFSAGLFALGGVFRPRDWKKTIALSLLPLVAFISFRGLVVNDFGIVSFAGTNLAGHATVELSPSVIAALPKQHKAMATRLFERKQWLPMDCAVNDEAPAWELVRQRFPCQDFLMMTAWLLAIEEVHAKVPFSNPLLNRDPWNHTRTLAPFFSIPNVEVDQKLSKFAKAVLSIRWKSYLKWVGAAFVVSIDRWWTTAGQKPLFMFGVAVLMPLLLIGCALGMGIRYSGFALLAPANLQPSLMWLGLGIGLFCGGILTSSMITVPNIRYVEQYAILLRPALWVVVWLVVSALVENWPVGRGMMKSPSLSKE